MSRTRAATIGLALPAGMALAMSADTSYRFLGATLGITNVIERAALCGVAEAAIVAFTVYAWATRSRPAAWLAYCIVLVQAVPAFKVSGESGGFVRVALGPVLLAVVLHFLLGLEVRMSGDRPDTMLRQAAREVRERITAYLGIGRRGADSVAIARSRAADRAVSLADDVAGAKTGSRRHRRRTARLAEALDRARHGLDATEAADAEAAIVARIVRRKSAGSLATITARHDWTATLHRTVPLAVEQVPVDGTSAVPALPAVPLAVEQVPVAVEQVPVDGTSAVPALPAVPLAVEQVPGTEQVRSDSPRVQGGTSASVLQDNDASDPLAAGTSVRVPQNHRDHGSAGQRPALRSVQNQNGTPTDHIRSLIAGGVTDAGTIRDALAGAGVKVPDQSYIRRLVRESRTEQVPPTGTGSYM